MAGVVTDQDAQWRCKREAYFSDIQAIDQLS
jgi:hypothetical protein